MRKCKHIAAGIIGLVPLELNRPRLAGWPWRKILADAGLLAAFAVTSSLLIRRGTRRPSAPHAPRGSQHHHQVPDHQPAIPVRNPADDVSFVRVGTKSADPQSQYFRGNPPRRRSGMHHQPDERTGFRRTHSKTEERG